MMVIVHTVIIISRNVLITLLPKIIHYLGYKYYDRYKYFVFIENKLFELVIIICS